MESERSSSKIIISLDAIIKDKKCLHLKKKILREFKMQESGFIPPFFIIPCYTDKGPSPDTFKGSTQLLHTFTGITLSASGIFCWDECALSSFSFPLQYPVVVLFMC